MLLRREVHPRDIPSEDTAVTALLKNARFLQSTMYRKSDLCIPRNETAQPRSQFLYIHVSVSNLYISMIGLPLWLQQKRQTDPEII